MGYRNYILVDSGVLVGVGVIVFVGVTVGVDVMVFVGVGVGVTSINLGAKKLYC